MWLRPAEQWSVNEIVNHVLDVGGEPLGALECTGDALARDTEPLGDDGGRESVVAPRRVADEGAGVDDGWTVVVGADLSGCQGEALRHGRDELVQCTIGIRAGNRSRCSEGRLGRDVSDEAARSEDPLIEGPSLPAALRTLSTNLAALVRIVPCVPSSPRPPGFPRLG